MRMPTSYRMKLTIAGESFAVDFDGTIASSPDFPGTPLEYTAPCGTRVTQEMLVAVCKSKTIPHKG